MISSSALYHPRALLHHRVEWGRGNKSSVAMIQTMPSILSSITRLGPIWIPLTKWAMALLRYTDGAPQAQSNNPFELHILPTLKDQMTLSSKATVLIWPQDRRRLGIRKLSWDQDLMCWMHQILIHRMGLRDIRSIIRNCLNSPRRLSRIMLLRKGIWMNSRQDQGKKCSLTREIIVIRKFSRDSWIR